jgi:hypothetical protein
MITKFILIILELKMEKLYVYNQNIFELRKKYFKSFTIIYRNYFVSLEQKPHCSIGLKMEFASNNGKLINKEFYI